jgi:hypothetical protein
MDCEYKRRLAGSRYVSDGKAVTNTILVKLFWDTLVQLTTVCESTVSVLRLVDGALRCAGELYLKMYQIDVSLSNSALKESHRNQICMAEWVRT